MANISVTVSAPEAVGIFPASEVDPFEIGIGDKAYILGAQGPQGGKGDKGDPGRDGIDGVNGVDGSDGADGYSPTVSVTSIAGGHEVSVTDAGGTSTFNVMDGIDGVDGVDGKDGIDGKDGKDGKDGVDGAPGQGVPTGGAEGQFLRKASSTDYDTGWYDFPSLAKGTDTSGYAVTGGRIDLNTASGAYSLAFGRDNTASAQAAVALGREATASGALSFAVGYKTTASNSYAHALGVQCTASGESSHAEGYGTKATAQAARSAGYQSEASGVAANAEGYITKATGAGAHSEGQSTLASGDCSHAEGLHTEANHAAQLVFGKYNDPDPSAAASTTYGDYVEIVGNGTDENTLSNARTLDWNGNEVIAGKLTVGAAPTANMDVATKKYVDEGTSANTQGIPFGTVDGTSTSTAFTATVPGITALKDGTVVMLKNSIVTSASGFTIDVNGLGAKPVYSNMATGNNITPTAPTRETTIFNINYTMLLAYSTDLVAGGAWICYRGYNSDTNTIAYQVRTNSSVMKTYDQSRYYRLFFTSADGTHWVPANTAKDNSATSAKTVNSRPIDPFGRIIYFSYTTNLSAESDVPASYCWDRYTFVLGYSFNKTGAALTLTSKAPVYIKAAPQSDGSAIIDSTTPYVQALPSTADGKIYIFLGIAYSATNVELALEHPVYEYRDGAIRRWTNAPKELPAVTSPTDDGKVLRVVSGVWTAVSLPSASGVSF